MSFEIVGKLHKKFETENKTDTFRAREFVIEVEDGQYPQMVKFQCVQDRTSIVDNVNEGDQIKVHFDLRGREWQGKYFTNLNAWRVEAISNEAPAGGAAPATGGFGNDFPKASDEGSSASAVQADDDLPF
ncbi:hypothetical protein CEQ90_11885 [Lewinellaceae bacterium SD302]|nr:hypothetical protein CEQ90_11885 [Lewinellaceae bacterium SD302]